MEFIFGTDDRILNMIYLVIKQYIIKARSNIHRMNDSVILNEIYQRIIIEKRKTSPYKLEREWNEHNMLVQHAENQVLRL